MAQIVTITNPLTGQPAQVDQLDHTAQEIDDAIARALPGGEIDITLQQITGATNAAEYSATATYAIGDYCTHDGKLYRCTTAITEPEDWTEAHWTETTVGSELTAIYTALQKKADLGADGKVPAEQVDAYSQSDSISAETRTALSLPETATPDAALAEIARQLSESGGVRMKLLWETSSPTSTFAAQTISINLTEYDMIVVVGVGSCYDQNGVNYQRACCGISSRIFPKGQLLSMYAQGNYCMFRNFEFNNNGVTFDVGRRASSTDTSENNGNCVPVEIYGVKGVT